MNKTNEVVTSLISEGYVVFFEDEAGIQRWNNSGYGQRRTGSQDTVKTIFSKQTAKLYGILGESGHHIFPVTKLNSYTFICLLKKILEKHEKHAIILDNASYHTSSRVKKFIESTKGATKGAIKLIFLPKYTPQLNGIKTPWRVLKGRPAGRCFKSVEEFRNAIRQVIRDEIKPIKVMDYITERYHPG